MRLTYIYHSSFALETGAFNAVFDYFTDRDGGAKIRELLNDEKKLYVFSSHSHSDHFNPEILRWKKRGEPAAYVFSSDIADFRALRHSEILYMSKNDSYTDANLRVNAFGSTDAGVSFMLEARGRKIFHAGDLNNWHWSSESTPEEAAKAGCDFLRELEDIWVYTDNVDLAMFPVDARMGAGFDLGARQFLDRIKVGYFSPMHFEWPEAGMEKARGLKSYAESRGAKFIDWQKPGDSVEF